MRDEALEVQVVSLPDKLAKAIGDFGAQLGSSKVGTLTQASDELLTLMYHGLATSFSCWNQLLTLRAGMDSCAR